MSEKALQIAEKRREMKRKGERERYITLNAELQRTEEKDKKGFLSEQCKEIEENNTMGKTRDLFKKIGDTKGTFHAKMSTIKDKNSKDLTGAEEFKKMVQEYIEELYRKGLNDLDNHHGMVTHLEPFILECEVKWLLGSITINKASGGDGIPAELLQTLKDDTVKALHSICQHSRKLSSGHRTGKGVFISIPKKGNTKESSNFRTIALISRASKIELKILQARLHQYVNQELPDVQDGFRKGRRTGDQIPNICQIIEKEKEFQKHLLMLH